MDMELQRPAASPPAPVSMISEVPDSSLPTASDANPVVAAKHSHLDIGAHVIPLGSDTHPEAQAERLAEAPQHKVDAIVEKVKGDEREELGEEPEGTIVDGLEDDKLWALVRRFNVVSALQQKSE